MLPRPMQLHLLIVTNRRLFTDVALFKSCEPEVVAVCLRVMGQQICVPFERVLVKGEPPRALFIIRSGHVQVVKDVAVGEQGGRQGGRQGARHQRRSAKATSPKAKAESATPCGALAASGQRARRKQRGVRILQCLLEYDREAISTSCHPQDHTVN